MNIKSYKITPLPGGGYELLQELETPRVEEGEEYSFVVFNCKDIEEVISAILPDSYTHRDFERLESVYMQERFLNDSFYSIADYMRMNNLKSRNSVYERIKDGRLIAKKIGKNTYVKEAE